MTSTSIGFQIQAFLLKSSSSPFSVHTTHEQSAMDNKLLLFSSLPFPSSNLVSTAAVAFKKSPQPHLAPKNSAELPLQNISQRCFPCIYFHISFPGTTCPKSEPTVDCSGVVPGNTAISRTLEIFANEHIFYSNTAKWNKL